MHDASAINGVTICQINYDCGQVDGICPENFATSTDSNAGKCSVCDSDCGNCQEVCDGIDNDGDGLIDESLTRTVGSGTCQGTQTCTNGGWSSTTSTDGNACGNCGTCSEGFCTSEGVCSPGTTIETQACGVCGTQSRLCTNTCSISNFGTCNDPYQACTYQNACDPGTGDDGCGTSCVRTISPPYTSSGDESGISCMDGIDNDCDLESDYDSLDGLHGDNNCAVGVSSISVSDNTPTEGSSITVTCTSTVPNVNSISASIGSTLCSFLSWSGNDARFSCNVGSAGTKTVKCSVDTSKSYKSGTDKTTSIEVIFGSCSGYSSSASCNADPEGRCEWCAECSGSEYSGGSSRCVDKGSCSYNLVAGQCGAVCDLTSGGCTTLTCDNYCSGGDLFVRSDVSSQCVDGSCTSVSCSTGTRTDCGEVTSTAPNTVGSCQNSCISQIGDDVCGTCTLREQDVSCASGWAAPDGSKLDADGCECQITNGGVEICDGIDNDCNGQVDEFLTRSAGSGTCQGTQTCTNGAWSDISTNGNACGNCGTCSEGLCTSEGICSPGSTRDSGTDYCSNQDVYNTVEGCTSSCTWEDASATDTLSQDCGTTTCQADGCFDGQWRDYQNSCDNTCVGDSCQSCTCTFTVVNHGDTDNDGIDDWCDTENTVSECNDGIDNDGDGTCDFAGCPGFPTADTGCLDQCASCEACGSGLFDLCDQNECLNCPSSTGVGQCVFDDGILFNGCSTDSDSDGVPDSIDACPGFDDNIDVDGDGVPDGCDQCAANPADSTSPCCSNIDNDALCDVDDPDDDGDGTSDNNDCNDLDPLIGACSGNTICNTDPVGGGDAGQCIACNTECQVVDWGTEAFYCDGFTWNSGNGQGASCGSGICETCNGAGLCTFDETNVNACLTDNVAGASCVSAGTCTITICDPGFADVNEDPGDGCEVDLNTDPNNCGSPGNSCLDFGTTECVNGVCQSCSDNKYDIDGDGSGTDTNGCEYTCQETDPLGNLVSRNQGIECCGDLTDNDCDGGIDSPNVCDKDGDGIVDKDAVVCGTAGIDFRTFETIEQEEEAVSIARLICNAVFGSTLCEAFTLDNTN